MTAQAAAIAPHVAPAGAVAGVALHQHSRPVGHDQLLCLVMAIVQPNCFRISNLMIILQDASLYMIVGVAMTLVITGRGIDLSIGAIAPRASTR